MLIQYFNSRLFGYDEKTHEYTVLVKTHTASTENYFNSTDVDKSVTLLRKAQRAFSEDNGGRTKTPHRQNTRQFVNVAQPANCC